MKRLLILAALAVMLGGEVRADFISQWNFDSATPDSNPSTGTINPSFGSGTASLVGGTTATFATGNGGGTDNSGWNTTAYAAQSAASGTRGVQFLVSTVGQSNITLSFDHRASGTASRWAQVDYTLDGGINWTTGFWNNNGGLSPHDTFYSFNVDLSSVTAANNNANFGFRIVSIFSQTAFSDFGNSYGANVAYQQARSTPTQSSHNYSGGGTWRFDNVTVSGVPEPTTGLLLGIGTLACAAFRRNRRVA